MTVSSVALFFFCSVSVCKLLWQEPVITTTKKLLMYIPRLYTPAMCRYCMKSTVMQGTRKFTDRGLTSDVNLRIMSLT